MASSLLEGGSERDFSSDAPDKGSEGSSKTDFTFLIGICDVVS